RHEVRGVHALDRQPRGRARVVARSLLPRDPRGARKLNDARDERQGEAPSAARPLLTVRGVTLQYRTEDRIVTATYRVSFDVHERDRFVVLGPSGCGKSTLLKAVGGFIEPAEGEIVLDGARIAAP